MAYCTVEQVQELMQLVFTRTSQPPFAKVEEMIEEVAGELDGVVEAAGYTLPIGATALPLLRRYNTYGTAAAVWHAGYITDADMPRVSYWQQEYKDFLARLRKGEQTLPDAVTEEGVSDPAFTIAGFHGMKDING